MLYLLLLPHYLPLYLSTSLPLSFSPHLSVSSIILCLTSPLYLSSSLTSWSFPLSFCMPMCVLSIYVLCPYMISIMSINVLCSYMFSVYMCIWFIYVLCLTKPARKPHLNGICNTLWKNLMKLLHADLICDICAIYFLQIIFQKLCQPAYPCTCHPCAIRLTPTLSIPLPLPPHFSIPCAPVEQLIHSPVYIYNYAYT